MGFNILSKGISSLKRSKERHKAKGQGEKARNSFTGEFY
jgi:hypothetical protein